MRPRVLPRIAVGVRERQVREEDRKGVAVAFHGGPVEQHLFFLLFDSQVFENLVEKVRADVRTVTGRTGGPSSISIAERAVVCNFWRGEVIGRLRRRMISHAAPK